MVVFDNKQGISVMAERSADDKTSWNYSSSNGFIEEKTLCHNANIYTDRALYRPGQKVKVNVLLYSSMGDDIKVAPHQAIWLIMRSPSGKWKSEISLETNMMGTVDFEVELPEDAEVGTYHINVEPKDAKDLDYSYAYFKVEEYKRPTFDVVFDKKDNEEQTYSLGDNVTIVGKAMAFNGVPVQGGAVKCTVECAQSDFWWWRNANWKKVGEMELTTDSEGKFNVPVSLNAL